MLCLIPPQIKDKKKKRKVKEVIDCLIHERGWFSLEFLERKYILPNNSFQKYISNQELN